MSFLYNTIIAQPIVNLMVLIYNYLPFKDLGITIILLTIFIRLLLLPLSYKAARTQREMAKIQPRLKEIQKKYKDDKEEQAKRLMEVYKEHKVNPFSGIVPILIQLPILIALYRAFMTFINDVGALRLYDFVSQPETINPTLLGLVDLSKVSFALAIAAGLLQFAYSKMMMQLSRRQQKTPSQEKPRSAISGMVGNQMTYFFPFITVLIASRLPAGMPLYWITTTLFSISEQILVRRRMSNGEMTKNKKEDSRIKT